MLVSLVLVVLAIISVGDKPESLSFTTFLDSPGVLNTEILSRRKTVLWIWAASQVKTSDVL